MKKNAFTNTIAASVLLLSLLYPVLADSKETAVVDWPRWGRTSCANMASPAVNLPAFISVAFSEKNVVDPAKSANLKWSCRLGSYSFGGPVISDGKVFAGTNACAYNPHLEKFDVWTRSGTVVCFNEADGSLLWQLGVPDELPNDNFCPEGFYLGVCSTPTVEGKKVFLTTNRNDVLCLDVKGLKDKNGGVFQDEAQYISGTGKDPVVLAESDGDILWRFNTAKNFGFWSHDVYASSPLLAGEYLFVSTGNSRKLKKRESPKPEEACLMALSAENGELIAADTEKMAARVLHGNWSSPTLGEVNGKKLVFFGGPNGVLYAFDADAEVSKGEGKKRGALKKVWSFDPNEGNTKPPYDKDGPAPITGSPVCVDNRVYFATGNDWSHLYGKGALFCVDATKEGDITKTGLIWKYEGLRQSVATPAISDGLLYITDVSGSVHCVDTQTGNKEWVYEGKNVFYASCVVADGKVYAGDARGRFYVFSAGKEFKILCETGLKNEVSGIAVANGALYVQTSKHLFAFRAGPEK